MNLDFFKYHALGNDMLVIDPAQFEARLTPALARRLCNRHVGVGADGICFGPLPGIEPPSMRFINPDGSEAEKSGNGLRIFARYLWDAGIVRARQFEIAINGERIPVTVEDESANTLSLGMGRVSFAGEQGETAPPATRYPPGDIEQPARFGDTTFSIITVSVGNPHCVIFVEGDADLAALARQWGPVIETAARFPQRTNVQFARVADAHTIEIEIWERGAGSTLASGTSASATAGAAVKTGRCQSPVTVRMAGGEVMVAIDAARQVTLTGPVVAVYRGKLAGGMLEK